MYMPCTAFDEEKNFCNELQQKFYEGMQKPCFDVESPAGFHESSFPLGFDDWPSLFRVTPLKKGLPCSGQWRPL